MKTQPLYIVTDVRTGKAVDFSLSPMSDNPTFFMVPVKRATRFKRHEAQAAACLLAIVWPETLGYLAIEEG